MRKKLAQMHCHEIALLTILGIYPFKIGRNYLLFDQVYPIVRKLR